ncbi:MAG: HD domain-containing protein [Deltaproteobacteria bacterium]|nr:HD domain-containing protein [Deltaproteobacteria bacterium]
MVPSIKTCFQLMERYEMLENIREHSIVVARIARLIGCDLLAAGETISLEKVTAAALLHDIAKTSCLVTKKDHAEEGRKICLRNGFEEIAPIVAEHVVLRNAPPNGRFSEKEVVYYADKRVNHHSIVSLEERLDAVLERYGGNGKGLQQRIRDNFNQCKALEKALFQKLSFAPEALALRLEQNPPQLVKCLGGHDDLA